MQSAKRPDFGKISADRKIQNEKENSQKNAKRECERTKVNPYKACIYGLCRDFLDGVGYDLGTKLILYFK